MSQDDQSGSESHEEQEEEERNWGNGNLTNYEKQRMKRIEENKARMKAMGLHKMANSLMVSVHKKLQNDAKGKRKADDDEDYMPPQENEGVSSSSEEEDQSHATRSRKLKKQNTTPNGKPPTKLSGISDYVEEYDDDLMQAIALSLQDSAGFVDVGTKVSSQSSREPAVNDDNAEKKPTIQVQEEAGKRKRKKTFTSRVQMTEDELILHFFQFDEAGKGGITVKDLCRIATAHDFTWSDKEMKDMIRVFDSDGDGKLSLDDFSKIVDQCNMRQRSENAAVGSRS